MNSEYSVNVIEVTSPDGEVVKVESIDNLSDEIETVGVDASANVLPYDDFEDGTDVVDDTLEEHSYNTDGIAPMGRTLRADSYVDVSAFDIGGRYHLVRGNAKDNVLEGTSDRDVIQGGAGADTMKGFNGDDIYYVDSFWDKVVEYQDDLRHQTGYTGNDTVVSSVDRDLELFVENLTLTGTANNGKGNAYDNILTGNLQDNQFKGELGDDTIRGGAGADTLTGAYIPDMGVGELDVLNGGAGADRIVLGNRDGCFYDDGKKGKGAQDYAWVTSFSPKSDTLVLHGEASDYLLGRAPKKAESGSGLFFDSNHNGRLDKSDELIAVLRSPQELTVANTIGKADFV